jgi:hypothetical protein
MSAKPRPRCQALTFDGKSAAKRCPLPATFRHRHAMGTPDWKVVHFTNACRKHSVELDAFEASMAKRARVSTRER